MAIVETNSLHYFLTNSNNFSVYVSIIFLIVGKKFFLLKNALGIVLYQLSIRGYVPKATGSI